MKQKDIERIVQLFFTYDDVEYKFDEDKIYYKLNTQWLEWFELPISITNYASNEDAIKTICIFSVRSYREGFKTGKVVAKREIRESLGIYN